MPYTSRWNFGLWWKLVQALNQLLQRIIVWIDRNILNEEINVHVCNCEFAVYGPKVGHSIYQYRYMWIQLCHFVYSPTNVCL